LLGVLDKNKFGVDQDGDSSKESTLLNVDCQHVDTDLIIIILVAQGGGRYLEGSASIGDQRKGPRVTQTSGKASSHWLYQKLGLIQM
jgi:hypothetical protein